MSETREQQARELVQRIEDRAIQRGRHDGSFECVLCSAESATTEIKHNVTCPVLDVARALAACALESREWAIKTICSRCLDGAVAHRVNENRYIENFDAVRRGDWFHLPTLTHDYSYCDAGKIHEAIWGERAAGEGKS